MYFFLYPSMSTGFILMLCLYSVCVTVCLLVYQQPTSMPCIFVGISAYMVIISSRAPVYGSRDRQSCISRVCVSDWVLSQSWNRVTNPGIAGAWLSETPWLSKELGRSERAERLRIGLDRLVRKFPRTLPTSLYSSGLRTGLFSVRASWRVE